MWYVLSDKGYRKVEDYERSQQTDDVMTDEDEPKQKLKGSRDKELATSILLFVNSMNTATEEDIISSLVGMGYKDNYVEHELNRLVSTGSLREFMHYPGSK